jgi:hypothetical protein
MIRRNQADLVCLDANRYPGRQSYPLVLAQATSVLRH